MTQLGFGPSALSLVVGATVFALCGLAVESGRRSTNARETRLWIIRFLSAFGIGSSIMAALVLAVGACVTFSLLNAFGIGVVPLALIVFISFAMLTAAVVPRTMPALGKVRQTISFRHLLLGIGVQGILLVLGIVCYSSIIAGQTAGEIPHFVASLLLLVAGIMFCGVSLFFSVLLRWLLIRFTARSRLRKGRKLRVAGTLARGRRALR